MEFYIHKDGYLYNGDFIEGAREATQEEINAHLKPSEPTKDEKIATLDAIYQPQFASLAQSLGVATLDGNQTVIAGIKEDYAALKAEYTSKMEVLV